MSRSNYNPNPNSMSIRVYNFLKPDNHIPSARTTIPTNWCSVFNDIKIPPRIINKSYYLQYNSSTNSLISLAPCLSGTYTFWLASQDSKQDTTSLNNLDFNPTCSNGIFTIQYTGSNNLENFSLNFTSEYNDSDNNIIITDYLYYGSVKI